MPSSAGKKKSHYARVPDGRLFLATVVVPAAAVGFSMRPHFRLYPLPFFFRHTAPTELYTLSLHDALPISGPHRGQVLVPPSRQVHQDHGPLGQRAAQRSEEHTSELQSRVDLVCRLLL